MILTWKDGLGTALVVSAVVLAVARLKGVSWAVFGGWRMGALSLLVIGIASCIVIGSGDVPDKNNWTMLATILGGAGFALAVAGLLFGSKAIYIALTSDIVLLWLLTSIHHMLGKGT